MDQSKDDLNVINYDLLSHPSFHRLFHWIKISNEPVLSEIIDVPSLFGLSTAEESLDLHEGTPHSLLIQPVFKGLDDCTGSSCGASDEIGGLLVAVIPWDASLRNVLPKDVTGITVVMENTCGDVFSYQVDGVSAKFVGIGDHHDHHYDYLEEIITFDPFDRMDTEKNDTVNCNYDFHLYPTSEFEARYRTSMPALLCFAVAMIFAFTTAAFATYDCLVQRRQEKVMNEAMKTSAIVSSLFPAEVRDRLMGKKKDKADQKRGKLLPTLTEAPKFRLHNFLADEENNAQSTNDACDSLDILDKPIADLFPSATVMFADIAGFTAWSSVRDPTQVFTLLETVYGAFDKIARKRGVFKVETIGDSYVAVCGLPEPNANHAVTMARFARDVVHKMNSLTKKLEAVLGPGTAELQMRVGLNSGPVTAGVLRGEKSRFQLFGDTVNTSARMESNGIKNQIQISQSTADEIKKAGKEHWFEPREDLVNAKGKGCMQTFWLSIKDERRTSSVGERDNNQKTFTGNGEGDIQEVNEQSQKNERLVVWAVDILTRLLKQIVSTRKSSLSKTTSKHDEAELEMLEQNLGKGGSMLEEVSEFFELPPFDGDLAERVDSSHTIALDKAVVSQLQVYVGDIFEMYRKNPFHNADHAIHCTMSINKLLGRIVSPDVSPGDKDYGQSHILGRLHERTYGISSDPLTQFAAVFSGLVHDVDHRGVPNFVLLNEDKTMSEYYKSRCIAEQNSVDIAWSRLFEPDMKELRRCIYTTPAELHRFRQAIVNIVLATDIFDKDCAEIRRNRWNDQFGSNAATVSGGSNGGVDDSAVHRKAAIVLEHLIQASDVAHTMQHWTIYQKFNVRLFEEMYQAHKSGRMPGRNPAEGWYQGELSFFDNYIIPLAKKLKQCGVFGVSSDEYLNYALENRHEWSIRGQDLVRSAVAKLEKDNNNADRTVVNGNTAKTATAA